MCVSQPSSLTKESFATDVNSNLVGSDLRKAIVDGYPVESCLATDLHGGKYVSAPPRHTAI